MCEFICIERICVVLSIVTVVKLAISETALVSKKKKKKKKEWCPLTD